MTSSEEYLVVLRREFPIIAVGCSNRFNVAEWGITITNE